MTVSSKFSVSNNSANRNVVILKKHREAKAYFQKQNEFQLTHTCKTVYDIFIKYPKYIPMKMRTSHLLFIQRHLEAIEVVVICV